MSGAEAAMIDSARWRSIEPLLDQALELSMEQRLEWLETLRTSAPDIAADVASLLDDDRVAEQGGFLDARPHASLSGMVVGAYTLARPLGHGGMGSVWLARRTDGRFEGEAALKLLNLSLLTEAGQERFRREGSALARLAHPGIARLLDAGVSVTGQPYLVLEYVDGQRVDDFVRSRAMSPWACVTLFLNVLDAVRHAHSRLIVHRDLKPSNILVMPDGAVKLLDFGIAKLLDGDGMLSPDALTLDSRMLTPEFAAPEQVHGDAITTATDVYALGVLLYVLLSGRHPTAEGCHTRAEVFAAMLMVAPARLALGDLDAVLAKALRVEPGERYQSVDALADDLRRWLHHEPVGARQDSVVYRARKFVRRHRGGLTVALACGALVGAYGTTVVIDRRRVSRALAEATENARRAEQVSDFAAGLFEAAGHGSSYADSLTARQLLERAVTRAHELSGQPMIEAQLLDLIGRIRIGLGDYDEARPVLQEALAIRQRVLGPDHPEVATSLMNAADALTQGDATALSAIPLRREALSLRRRLFGDDDPRTTDALYALASDLHGAGDYRAARPLFDEWMARIRHQPPQLTPTRAEQLSMLSSIMEFSHQPARAESLIRQALAMERALYGDAHLRVAVHLAQLGGILSDMHRWDAADSTLRASIEMLRKLYPDGHPELANALRDRGLLLISRQRWDDAEPVWRESAEVYRRFMGETSMGYANARSFLGLCQAEHGRFVDAEHTLRQTLSLAGTRRPSRNPIVARTRVFLGEALRGQGRLAEAEPLLLEGFRSGGPLGLAAANRTIAAQALVKLYDAEGRRTEADKYRASSAER